MLRVILSALILSSTQVSAETLFKWGLESQTDESKIEWRPGEGGLHVGDVVYTNRRSSYKTLQFIGQTVLFVIQTPYGQVNVYVLPRDDFQPDRFWVEAPYGITVDPEVIESVEGEEAVISLWLPMS